jgi:DNA (cytosine-5)-methyltransferase 1
MIKIENQSNLPSELMGHIKRQTSAGKAPLLISLFAGTGGSSEGYRLAGFKELLAIEYDTHAARCFSLNFPDVPVEKWDILEINGKDILARVGLKPGELDLFDASPPCQGFSKANTKVREHDPRNDLFLKTIKLIGEVQPKCVLIENVLGMIQGKNKVFFNKVKVLLKRLNYTWQYTVAKAEEYGVPQARRRVIIVAVRNDIFNAVQKPFLIPRSDLSKVDEMNLGNVLPDVVAYSPGQFADKINLANKPVCTITKTVSLWLYGKDGLRRRPTIKELKILSSFPDDFILVGGFNQQWARIGNAVPPNLIKAFANYIKEVVLTQYILSYHDTIDSIATCSKLASMYSLFGYDEPGYFNLNGVMDK